MPERVHKYGRRQPLVYTLENNSKLIFNLGINAMKEAVTQSAI